MFRHKMAMWLLMTVLKMIEGIQAVAFSRPMWLKRTGLKPMKILVPSPLRGLFSCGLATLKEALSVHRSVRPSVRDDFKTPRYLLGCNLISRETSHSRARERRSSIIKEISGILLRVKVCHFKDFLYDIKRVKTLVV